MESSNGMSQGHETSSQPGIPSSTPAPVQSAPAPAHDERTFKQSEVNDIVKRAKHGAVEDYRRLQSEQPQYAQQKYNEGSGTQAQPNQATNAVNMPDANVRQIAAEEMQRLRDQWMQDAKSKSEAEYAQRTVQTFWNKIAPGKEKYQDFETVTGDIEYARFPNVVQLLADHVDNSHDVLYEFGKDRTKMAAIENLAYMSPRDAVIQLKRMSQVIKDNEAAGNVKVPNEPLHQMRPSNTGTDNGVMSVKDYRSKYRV